MTNSPTGKWAKDVIWHFIKKDTQLDKKHIKILSLASNLVNAY